MTQDNISRVMLFKDEIQQSVQTQLQKIKAPQHNFAFESNDVRFESIRDASVAGGLHVVGGAVLLTLIASHAVFSFIRI